MIEEQIMMDDFSFEKLMADEGPIETIISKEEANLQDINKVNVKTSVFHTKKKQTTKKEKTVIEKPLEKEKKAKKAKETEKYSTKIFSGRALQSSIRMNFEGFKFKDLKMLEKVDHLKKYKVHYTENGNIKIIEKITEVTE